jgi:hypothetical protein
MPSNYVLLERIELNASAASVTFSNIPQSGYTDLKVVISARGTASGVGGGNLLSINGSSGGTNFTCKLLQGNGGIAASGSPTNFVGDIPLASATASTFGNIEITFPNYTSSNYKSYSIDSVTENSASGTDSAYADLAAGLWSQTTAISSLGFSQSSGSFVQYSTFSLYGLAAVGTTPVIAPKASGGNITTDGTYWIHTFNSSGTFTPLTGLTANYLVVAGGGGGGSGSSGGGGGAGGLRSTVTATGGGGTLESALSLTAQAYAVTVGAGGAAVTKGSDSVFSTITSNAGGGSSNVQLSMNGGSGAGSSAGGGDPASYKTGTGTTNQGYAGGVGYYAGSYYPGGGGGGAGAVGGGASSSTQAGNGGAGVAVAITGSSVYYAGGGGGGGQFSGSAGSGGNGGGGAGSVTVNGTAGTTNTGGGGGGCGYDGTGRVGGAGGSGIVIIRYTIA